MEERDNTAGSKYKNSRSVASSAGDGAPAGADRMDLVAVVATGKTEDVIVGSNSCWNQPFYHRRPCAMPVANMTAIAVSWIDAQRDDAEAGKLMRSLVACAGSLADIAGGGDGGQVPECHACARRAGRCRWYHHRRLHHLPSRLHRACLRNL